LPQNSQGAPGPPGPPPQKKRFSPGERLLFILLFNLIVFSLIETGLRIHRALQKREAFLNLKDYQIQDPLFGWKLKPGYESEDVKINSLGFRNEEFTPAKPAGEVRIFCLGDSCTFGGRDPYPQRLGRKFHDRGMGEVRVINGGVPGYPAVNIYYRLGEEVIPCSPDIVTIYAGWNDLSLVNPERAAGQDRTGKALAPIYDLEIVQALRSAIFRHGKLDRFSTTASEFVERFEPAHLERVLDEILALCREHRVRPYLMNLASYYSASYGRDECERIALPPFVRNFREYAMLVEKYNRAIAAAAKRHGVPLIDQFAFFNARDKKRLFIDGGHFSEEGADEAADLLYEALSKDPVIRVKSRGSVNSR